MATTKLPDLVSRLGPGLLVPVGTDADLLGRLLATRDEQAFTLLVRRHGPMVFGVCRRVTGDHHLAEDAFQAVFVVLAAKAGSVRPRAALPAWLYGVAYRTALRARTMSDRRRRRETPVETLPEPAFETIDPVENSDVAAILDEEIARLPEPLRVAVVFCELEGRSRQEAAGHLGRPEGTLSSRLAKARKLGASVVVDVAGRDLIEAVSASDAREPDVVFEAVGKPEVWEAAVNLVRKGGLVSFFGGCPSGTTVVLDTSRVHYSSISTVASFHHTPRTIRRALEFIESGVIRAADFVDGECSLDDLPALFRQMTAGNRAVKTLVRTR